MTDIAEERNFNLMAQSLISAPTKTVERYPYSSICSISVVSIGSLNPPPPLVVIKGSVSGMLVSAVIENEDKDLLLHSI